LGWLHRSGIFYLITNPIHSSQKTHCVSITKTKLLMLFRECRW
jgi:hypothetical protein